MRCRIFYFYKHLLHEIQNVKTLFQLFFKVGILQTDKGCRKVEFVVSIFLLFLYIYLRKTRMLFLHFVQYLPLIQYRYATIWLLFSFCARHRCCWEILVAIPTVIGKNENNFHRRYVPTSVLFCFHMQHAQYNRIK